MSIERIDNNYLAYADNVNQIEKVQNGAISTPISIHEISKNKENERVNNFEKKSICLSNQERVIKAQKLRERLSKVKENQAFIGNCWDGVKNFFGKDTGSEHVENQIKAFERGELSEEEIEKIFNEYKIGQEEVVDVTADIVSGIAAVGIYTAAVAAAPFSGGASIAVGAAAATATGAAIKTGIKYADASAKGKEYDSVGYDLATGAFSGVLAPITGGVGGAVGKSVATKLGVQAISETGKAMAGNTLKAGAYNMLFNPTGYKYAGGSMLKRAAAFGTECAADGAIGGSVDNMFRASLNGEDIIAAGANGFVGGLVLAPAIGGGIKGAGKLTQKAIKIVSGTNINPVVVNELEVELNGLKTRDGKPLYNEYEVNTIMSFATEENLPILKELVRINANNGSDWWGIDNLVKIARKEDIPYIEELSKLKIDDRPLFNCSHIAEIISLMTPENEILVKKLIANSSKTEGEYMLIGNINKIIKAVDGNNKQLIDYLIDLKTKDGEPRFTAYDIKYLMETVTDKDMSNVIELTNMQNKNGEYIFFGSEIPFLLGVVTKDNLPIVKELANLKTKDGDKRFTCSCINELLEKVTPENLELAIEIAKLTKQSGEPLFYAYEICYLLEVATPENISFIKELANITTKDGKNKFCKFEITYLIEHINKVNISFVNELSELTLSNGKFRFSLYEISRILEIATEENMAFIKELAQMEVNGTPRFEIFDIVHIAKSIENNQFIKANFAEIHKKVIAQIKLMLKEPEKYINGDNYSSLIEMQKQITNFIFNNNDVLCLAAGVLDKDSLNNLMRMRLNDASEYLDVLSYMSSDNLQLYKKLCEAKDVNGKEFCGNQKIEMIDLMKAYIDNRLPFDKMKRMVAEGKVDIEELNRDLFINIMKDAGLSDDEIVSIPNERFKKWDLKLIHLLAKEIKSSREPIFSDVFRLGNFSNNFKKSIHDTSTSYGNANAQTRKMFEETGMNYYKWVTPSKENEVHFTLKDKNFEQLSQIGKQLIEDIEILRKSPFIKKHIDANFQKFIKGDEFVISAHILADKKQLSEFIASVIEKLDKFWTMAKGNLEKPNLAARARNTLTILEHLNQRIKDVAAVENTSTVSKNIDVTIKMWDRDPQHDIFQGNYSTCCIGLGNGNGSAMPHYLMNTSYNMIELVDNKTGKTIGNALCFFVKGTDGKPKFIIDNIEINNANKSSNEIGLNLRSAIAEYASKVAKDVTGNDDTLIYMGQSYNDVPIDDLNSTSQNISFLGDVGIADAGEIYMDLYGGWIEKSEFSKNLTLLKLR